MDPDWLIAHSEKCVERARCRYGEESPAVARALMMLARCLERHERPGDAIGIQRTYVEMLRRHDDTDKIWLADAEYGLAIMLMRADQDLEAGKLLKGVVRAYSDEPKRKRDLLQAMQWWARALSHLWFLDEARRVLVEVVDQLSHDHEEKGSQTIAALSDLARVEALMGNFEVSFELQRQVIAIYAAARKPDTKGLLSARSCLAAYLHWAERDEEAMDLVTEVLRTQERELGSEHEDTKYSAELLDAIEKNPAK